MKIIDALIKRQETLSLLYSPANTEVYTPITLVKEMLDKLPNTVWSNPDLKFCDPTIKSGVFLSEIMIRLMRGLENFERNENKRYIYIVENMIYGYTTSDLSYRVVKKLLLLENSKMMHNVFTYNFLEEENKMKFDVIAGNPPYNSEQNFDLKKGGGDTLWDKFVPIAFDKLESNGYICFVHPMGWRSPVGRYTDIKKIIFEKNLIFLSMNNVQSGLKTFKVGTAYDYYVCQNKKYSGKTIIKDFFDNIMEIDISNLEFIPNGMFKLIYSLISKKDDDKCKVLYDSTSYESRRDYISKKKNKKFKYVVAHGVSVNNVPNIIYSSRNDLGFYGIPKIIFGKRTCGTFIDFDGKYACSQHTSAIVDDIKILDLINKCMQSKKFIELMSFCNWNSTAPDKYNKNMISLFKKDFWKYFIDENGKEI